VGLRDPRSVDASLVGAKAANLARCAAAYLPVLAGVVVTTAATELWQPGEEPPDEVLDALRSALRDLTRGRPGPLVVRSSSTAEDAEHSSMAGRFRSVLGIDGWAGVVAAVRAVRDSALLGDDPPEQARPLAVLVQPQIPARHGGVLFGTDPVDGDRGHLVVEVVPGNPSTLVSGEATARHLVLSRRGRRLSSLGDGPAPGRRERRALASLARRAERLFHGPQDVEWAYDGARVWLLQSRPVTAVAERTPTGPVLGPGPVAETFPDPLRRLEVESWLEPVRDGIVEALRATRAVPARRLDSSPVALAVGGWAAVDLELLGVHRSRGPTLNPLVGTRRLVAACRVGRLRATLPALAAELIAEVDEHLADVPPLAALSDDDLVRVIANARAELGCVHAHEILAGMLLAPERESTPAPALALAALAGARATGHADGETIAEEPVVLTLMPPRFGGTAALPASLAVAPGARRAAPGRLDVRDTLRVRARWLQELGARAMGELGTRLTAAGRLPAAGLVRDVGLAELERLVAGDAPPPDLADRAAQGAGPPLPPQFRLTPGGAAVAVRPAAGRRAGLGAGGGG
jgi:pyruvate,water dikinase